MPTDTTPRLALPYIAAGQAQKHVTHNDALLALDALVQLAVLDRTRTAPPATPTDGDRHIVAAAPTGAWAGQARAVAVFQDGGWDFHPPRTGWLAWVAGEATFYLFDGTAWQLRAQGVTSVNPVAMVGVNTTADATNRLAVKSEAVLFSHEDLPVGSGHVRLTCNKSAAAKTASLLLQTGYSGRVEIGTSGSDDLRIKTSTDGASWREAVFVRASDGAVGLNNRTSPAFGLDVGGTLGAGAATFAGSVLPAADNAHALGASSFRWSTLYAATGTINTSDARLKADIADCPLGLDFIRALAPKLYRWRDGGSDPAATVDDGITGAPRTGRRLHAGLIAQDVKAALDAAGIDCGLWVLDDRDDPDSLQSLRYEELIAPLVQAVKQLAQRVEVLERAS